MDSFSAFIQEHDGAWFAEPSLVYPKPLAGEQCSSSATAFYKASLLQDIAPSAAKGCLRVADLTGGLGVDAWAFSQEAAEVLYNEMDADLADAARHNFAALGRFNIRVSCAEITADSLSAVLGNFAPDVIFLDPARRSASGQKVFRLADCSPDLIALKDSLLQVCPTVLVKVSPMADIAQLGRELGDWLQAVHVVAVGDECKELLLLLQRPGDPVRLAVHSSGTDRPLVAKSEEICSSQPVRIGLYAVQLPAAWSGSRMLRGAFFQVLCDEEHPARAGAGTDQGWRLQPALPAIRPDKTRPLHTPVLLCSGQSGRGMPPGCRKRSGLEPMGQSVRNRGRCALRQGRHARSRPPLPPGRRHRPEFPPDQRSPAQKTRRQRGEWYPSLWRPSRFSIPVIHGAVSNYQSFTSHQETEAIKAAISSRLARAERKSCHWARLRTQLCSGYCIL